MSDYIGNRYKIVKLIGKGGMADVYLAYDVILKREVAVKILKADMSDDPVALERFKREAVAITKLSHPNIVDVYDVGDEGNRHYIVMEYVKGYTLKQLIKKRGPIPYKEAVWMIKQISSALMEAHRNHVIHRDIKSQNVLIKDDGTIKLSDFGIAMASDAMQITHKDSILGSVHYLAPEITQGKPATMQSDIYSLGIVFYELLMGDVPFKAENPVQVALKHVKGKIPSVRKYNPEIPQSIENIIIKATAKDLNNRYKNTALMIQDLNDCLRKDHRNQEKIEFKENSDIKKEEVTVSSKNHKGSHVFNTLFIIAISILSIAILFLVLYLSGIIGNNSKMVTIPELYNLTLQEARDILAENGLETDDSRITWELSDTIEKDHIISSTPEQGTQIERGSRIKLTISRGIYSVLDSYIGKDYKEAQEDLISHNFKVRLIPVDSKEEPGTVIEQSLEAGYKYDESDSKEITIHYAKEDGFLLPFDLKGMDVSSAVSFLRNNDIDCELSLQTKYYFTEDELLDTSPGTLVKTFPELGSIYMKSNYEKVIIYYYQED